MFSGCGGMDLGFEQAGFKVAWANDVDPDACATYRHNIGHIHEGDVTTLDIPNIESVDVLTSGFPCQPFSNAGSRKGVTDPRGVLYETTMKFVETLKPKAVVIENVRGILSTRVDNERLIDIIESRLKKLGYFVEHRLLNLSHFGVPQNRIRVLMIAVKQESWTQHVFPVISPGKNLSLKVTLSGLTDNHLNQTELMKLNPQALHYGAMIPPGGSWKSLPYDVLPERWKKIRNNMAKYHYPNFFRRYAEHEISGTITAAFKPENAGVWHPIEPRILSVREIARIQSFPDNFAFMGRTVKSKYQQIGNAVPPHLAYQVATQIKTLIDGKQKPKDRILPESYELNVNQPLHRQAPDLMSRMQRLSVAAE